MGFRDEEDEDEDDRDDGDGDVDGLLMDDVGVHNPVGKVFVFAA